MLKLIWLLAQSAEPAPKSGWQNIVDGRGISISLTGMAIVFAALVIITLFIAAVPRVLDVLEPYLPKGHGHHASPSPGEETPLDHEKVVAAIGMVLHTEMQKAVGKTD